MTADTEGRGSEPGPGRRDDEEKRFAAEAAALEVADGMNVGLGTGSTVAFFLPALARRRLAVRCVATSPATEEAARGLGIDVLPFEFFDRLDLAVDGADQVSPDHWLIKGGGGAHTREKVVAAAAERFIVIVSSDKHVRDLQPPVPLEVLAFGLQATLRRLAGLGQVRVREVPLTPDGNVVADYLGPVGDPMELAAALDGAVGVVAHGLFPPAMVSEVITGVGDRTVRALTRRSP
jgi:ribose 5-phosphate isomerase A